MNSYLKFLIGIIIGLTVISCLGLPEDDTDYTPEREAAIISEYIDSLFARGYDVDTSAAGVYYVILEEGEGDYVQPGDSIGIKYVGFFPENSGVFDTSEYWYDDGIWKFTYSSANLISGFYNAISLLNKGTTGLFMMPSDLAYGSTGTTTIPPYSPIVFELELADIYQQSTE
ncbi:FKBP-type peptidyl-prolyl cis-trans isomerase FkpA [Mariniphaga anaerophila]|uniref:Peptidyl-prolyl cis-trans isomerase n=2 Tax=Mariniphaga anaerophila TaxID=1484053 RepID=A0A1M4TMM4_9BACT|nr:FKBP-type peptidyl-prolyl cis-trans isomerase FkpA [Mariniphaga anaerophila]